MPTVNPELASSMQACTDREKLPIGLLANPRSYKNSKFGIDALLRTEFAHLNVYRFEVSNRAQIAAAVAQLHDLQAGLIIADGGDGTVQGVITETWHAFGAGTMPDLAVIPGGRTNVISGDLNGNGTPAEILRKIMHSYCMDQKHFIQQRGLLHISLPQAKDQLAFLISAGGLAAGIESCWKLQKKMQRLGPLRGLATPLWVVFKLLTTLPGQPLLNHRLAKVKVDDQVMPDEDFQVLIATMNQNLPMGIRPFWGDSTACDRIRFSTVTAKARGLWWRILPMIMGWKRWLPQHRGYASVNADTLHLQLDESIHIDGERWTLDSPSSVQIRVSAPIRFVTASSRKKHSAS